MRYHQLREFDIPGVDFLGRIKGQAAKTNPGRAPLDTMKVTQEFKGLMHQGVDLSAPVGLPVYAPEDGVVSLSKGLRAGLFVILKTATATHKFMHLSAYTQADGAKVTAGTVIGKTGNTGFTTGPHLHWEKWVGGKAVNPL